MSRDKPSLTYSPTTNTIKFTSPTSTTREEITESDISIAQIKSLQLSLELAIPPLEERLASLTQAVRDAVQKQQLSTARSLLKSKKLVENTLEKRRANLLQVEESLLAIDNAADNVAIIQSMQKSAAVMKTLNESVGGVEGVERITDALRDEMAVAEDIGKIIAEPGAAAVDEGDVEDEFEALVAEEKKKVAEKEKIEREKREAIERAERERREIVERAEKEKREKEEAEATSKRLAELEAFEIKKDEERKQAEALSARLDASEQVASVSEPKSLLGTPQSAAVSSVSSEEETSLLNSMEMMRSMSLDETKPTATATTEKNEDEHKEREPILAS
jgi:charged multivesicular body protein 7